MNRFLLVLLCCFSVGCAQPMTKSTSGALAGGTLGAGLGAIVGSQTGHAGPGIAIGAAAGALSGALLGNALDNQDREREAAEAQIAANQRQIDENRRLIEELRSRGADVRTSSRGVVVNLPDVLFEFASSRLTREARRTIDEVADVLQKTQGRTIAVEGHTDSVGSVIYNKRLSVERATSVAQELEYHGIPRTAMRVSGYGEGAPIATNNTEAGRARNRRVEVIVENR